MNIFKPIPFIISFFILFFLEVFFLKIFGLSIFIIAVISMWKRVKDVWFFIYISLFSVLLDVMLHTATGLHMSVIAILLICLELLFLIIPRDGKFKYFSIFIVIFLYYILSLTLNSLLLYGILPNIITKEWIYILIRSIISVGVCALVDRVFLSIRDNSKSSRIRLK